MQYINSWKTLKEKREIVYGLKTDKTIMPYYTEHLNNISHYTKHEVLIICYCSVSIFILWVWKQNSDYFHTHRTFFFLSKIMLINYLKVSESGLCSPILVFNNEKKQRIFEKVFKFIIWNVSWICYSSKRQKKTNKCGNTYFQHWIKYRD